ncbi:hypothetical protein E2C01_062699 [Portunus trituberculatus]|uniref:Uncharacterized protein n=1 Tax=Portunus trituberculatus TaxID=210409 RepID=A0A5B7HGT0_PORTR|nr:hypothetical protein [Portunus trituberculatus]
MFSPRRTGQRKEGGGRSEEGRGSLVQEFTAITDEDMDNSRIREMNATPMDSRRNFGRREERKKWREEKKRENISLC